MRHRGHMTRTPPAGGSAVWSAAPTRAGPHVNEWALRRAARALRAGGVIAYPTEAVWGLGCDPLQGPAVRRLLELKHRPMEKGLILIAAEYDQLLPYVRPLDVQRMGEILGTWPGPVTWLLPAQDDVPHWLRGRHDTLAVRVTAHPIAAALCRAHGGAIVSTSANVSGRPPARSALKVRRQFGAALHCILPGKTGAQRRPSTIRDGASGRVLRKG